MEFGLLVHNPKIQTVTPPVTWQLLIGTLSKFDERWVPILSFMYLFDWKSSESLGDVVTSLLTHSAEQKHTDTEHSDAIPGWFDPT